MLTKSGESLLVGERISTKDHYDIVDPNTTEMIGHAPEATAEHALAAAAAAKEALSHGRHFLWSNGVSILEKQQMR